MRLERRLRNISPCFALFDNVLSGIWVWCVDAIVYELGSFKLIVFSDGSLVLNIVVGGFR